MLIYLLAYSITIVAAFGILASIERAGARTVLLTDLEGCSPCGRWRRSA